MRADTSFKPIFILSLCLVLWNAALFPAPSSEKFRLSGIVKSAAQKPVKDASVLVESLMDDQIKLETTTNADGEWSVLFQDPGIWRITVTAGGYRPATRTIVTVKEYTVVRKDGRKIRIFDISKPRKTWYAEVHTEIHKGLKDLPETITLSTFQNQPLVFVLKKADSGNLQEAKKAIYKKDWPQAAVLLHRIIRELPGSEETASALYWLAYSENQRSRQMKSREQAVEVMQMAVEYLNRLIRDFPHSEWNDDAMIFRIDIAHSLYKKGVKDHLSYIAAAVKISEPSKIDLRLAALDALMSIDRPRAVGILRTILNENRDAGVRRKVILILSRFPDQQTLDILQKVAENDASGDVRSESRLLLEQIEAFKKIDKGE